jgi:hypothetical protein
MCSWFACRADVLGIHGNPLRAIPIFLVYLATLRHHYRWGWELDGGGLVATRFSSIVHISVPLTPMPAGAAWQPGTLPGMRPQAATVLGQLTWKRALLHPTARQKPRRLALLAHGLASAAASTLGRLWAAA